MTKHIAVLPCDGAGKEVVPEAIEARNWTYFPPLGRRSNGGGQAFDANMWGGVPGGYRATINDNVVLILMIETLEGLKNEGKVRAVGATHYQESAFPDLVTLMKTKRLDMVQIPYNPIRRTAERELLPLAESMGLGVFVMSPLQHGILNRHPDAAQLEELGVETWAQAILRWIASDPRVSTVLTATHDLIHLKESARAGDPPLFTPEQRALVVRIADSAEYAH